MTTSHTLLSAAPAARPPARAETPRVYTPETLAEALSTTVDRFRALRPMLEVKHGFPRRLPGLNARWSREAVDHWIRTAGAGVPSEFEVRT